MTSQSYSVANGLSYSDRDARIENILYIRWADTLWTTESPNLNHGRKILLCTVLRNVRSHMKTRSHILKFSIVGGVIHESRGRTQDLGVSSQLSYPS